MAKKGNGSYKRLTKKQKEALISWIAEGLKADEINKRSAAFGMPFKLTRQNIDYYRKKHRVDVDTLIVNGEESALNTGLAVKELRVEKLQRLGALLEKDIFGGSLWLDQEKCIGGGKYGKFIIEQEFNKAEVESYRGVLDDIARELGHRVNKQDITLDQTVQVIGIEVIPPDGVN